MVFSNVSIISLSLVSVTTNWMSLVSTSKNEAVLVKNIAVEKTFGSFIVQNSLRSSLQVRESCFRNVLSPAIAFSMLKYENTHFEESLDISASASIINCYFTGCRDSAITSKAGNLEINVSGCVFIDCTHHRAAGGAISINRSVAFIDACCFVECVSLGYGGAVYVMSSDTKTAQQCSFVFCSSEQFGAHCLTGGDASTLYSNFSFCAGYSASAFLHFMTQHQRSEYISINGGESDAAVFFSLTADYQSNTHMSVVNTSNLQSLFLLRGSNVVISDSVFVSSISQIASELQPSTLNLISCVFGFDYSSLKTDLINFEDCVFRHGATSMPFGMTVHEECIFYFSSGFTQEKRQAAGFQGLLMLSLALYI